MQKLIICTTALRDRPHDIDLMKSDVPIWGIGLLITDSALIHNLHTIGGHGWEGAFVPLRYIQFSMQYRKRYEKYLLRILQAMISLSFLVA